MAKMYSNTTRKPMMGGGYAMRNKMSKGGSARKKMAEGMTATANSMTAAEREALIKRRAQLQKAVDAGNRPEEILMEMRRTITQITDQLGESVTPGRASVDAPEPKMYGGMAGKKK